MKKRLLILAVACTAMLTIWPRTVNAAAEISAGIQISATADFTAPLSAYGGWIDYKSYGRCWHPASVEADWRPYADGSWEWTDAGWYWNSDEPWAWACYHYGSWSYDSSIGWVWIPGTDWAPAWVTWRYSDDYIGWAPCGPGLAVLAPSLFTFCDVHHFRDNFRPHELIVNNTTIINRTKVVKDFQRQSVNFDGHQRTIFANKGPGVDTIQRVTGAKFTPRPIGDVMHETQTRAPANLRHDEGQRPAEPTRQTGQPRINQETKPAEQPNRDALPPTGKEQPRTYREVPSPNPAPEPRKEISTPEQRPMTPSEKVLPPTGREPAPSSERRESAPVIQAPESKKEIPAPEQRPMTPSEKVLPPTGREPAPSSERRESAPVIKEAPATKAPPAQAAPSDGHDRDGRDGHRDGNGQ